MVRIIGPGGISPETLIFMDLMKLMITVRLLWTFYRNFLLASWLITACSAAIFWQNGLESFVGLFWFKVATLGIIWFFVNSYKRREYYYYLNRGLSKWVLWTSTLMFDFALFLFVIVQTYKNL